MADKTERPPLIYSKISDAMNDISAIGKTNNNTSQGYKFRGIDDVYNELHSVLSKHRIFTVPQVIEERSEIKTTKSGTELIYRILKISYTFFAEDGSSVYTSVIGEGMDSGDKASNKAMAVAHKYALLQVFCIPTAEAKDPEHDSHEVAAPRPFQNAPQQVSNSPAIPVVKKPAHSGPVIENGIIMFGKFKDKHISSIADKDWMSYFRWFEDNAEKTGKSIPANVLALRDEVERFMRAGNDGGQFEDTDIPF